MSVFNLVVSLSKHESLLPEFYGVENVCTSEFRVIFFSRALAQLFHLRIDEEPQEPCKHRHRVRTIGLTVQVNYNEHFSRVRATQVNINQDFDRVRTAQVNTNQDFDRVRAISSLKADKKTTGFTVKVDQTIDFAVKVD